MERKMWGAATKKRIAAMLLAAAVAFTASVLDCITDVMVVGGADESVADSYAEQGWTVIAQDLNAGCGSGSDYIYLLYKSADSASVSNGFITGFYIKTGAVTNELTHAGRGYHLAPCAGDDYFVKERQGDLNSNAGGDYSTCTSSPASCRTRLGSPTSIRRIPSIPRRSATAIRS